MKTLIRNLFIVIGLVMQLGASPAESFLLPGFLKTPTIQTKCDQVLVLEKFSICYLYDSMTPSMAFYKLTSDDVLAPIQPREYLRMSSLVPNEYKVSVSKYSGTGYDAGHLPAASSVDTSESAADDVYQVTWCAPQDPELNRQLWKYIEVFERKMALVHGEVYIITGIILSDKKTTSGVGIPTSFYKIIYIPSTNDMIAFLASNVPNALRQGDNIDDYLVPVSQILDITGIKLINFK